MTHTLPRCGTDLFNLVPALLLRLCVNLVREYRGTEKTTLGDNLLKTTRHE